MNNKVYGSEDLCRFCEEEEETFDHIINECPCFHLDRCDLLQNQPIINSLNWDPDTLLKFANIDTIKDALSFNLFGNLASNHQVFIVIRLICLLTIGFPFEG